MPKNILPLGHLVNFPPGIRRTPRVFYFGLIDDYLEFQILVYWCSRNRIQLYKTLLLGFSQKDFTMQWCAEWQTSEKTIFNGYVPCGARENADSAHRKCEADSNYGILMMLLGWDAAPPWGGPRYQAGHKGDNLLYIAMIGNRARQFSGFYHHADQGGHLNCCEAFIGGGALPG